MQTKDIETPTPSTTSVEMQTTAKKRGFFSRQPLTAFSRTAIASFWGLVALNVGLAFFSTLTQVLFVSAMMLLSAVLIMTRFRWGPIMGALITSLFLYVFLFKEPLTFYYLFHAKNSVDSPWVSFLLFTLDVLFLGGIFIACKSSIAALIQNYQRAPRTPRWFRFSLIGSIGVLIMILALGAILPSAPNTMTAVGGGDEPLLVHMKGNTFAPASVTISVNSSIVLFNDGFYQHTISNGTWMNGQAHPEQEAGAPVVDHAKVNGTGRNLEIGKFETPGTYHFYCALSPGMTLTVIVTG